MAAGEPSRRGREILTDHHPQPRRVGVGEVRRGHKGRMTVDDKYRDWLILSLKWSHDELVWYASGSSGYTKNLLRAGRYTEKEAKAQEASHPTVLVAVHLEVAMSLAQPWVTVANGTDQMELLRKRMADRKPKKVRA
jgi:hypothetical protein